MEREKGFEPSTPTLARLCSTPELLPHEPKLFTAGSYHDGIFLQDLSRKTKNLSMQISEHTPIKRGQSPHRFLMNT